MSQRDDTELYHSDELPEYEGMSLAQLNRQIWAYEAWRQHRDFHHTLEIPAPVGRE